MAGSGVTAQSLRDGFLRGLILAYPALADPSLDVQMVDAIAETEAMVARELGTRFGVVHFRPTRDALALAVLPAGEEYEFPMQWSGRIPGDGFPRLRPRVRPIVEIIDLTLDVPGSLVKSYTLPLNWLRVDRQTHEIVVAPSAGTAPYALVQGLGLLNYRLPATAKLDYRAGLDDAALAQWPQIKRLVAVKSMILLMPTMSLWVNPGMLTSESADGLSQSRGSGYMFKDMEDRLGKEAETLLNRILDTWEGPSVTYL